MALAPASTSQAAFSVSIALRSIGSAAAGAGVAEPPPLCADAGWRINPSSPSIASVRDSARLPRNRSRPGFIVCSRALYASVQNFDVWHYADPARMNAMRESRRNYDVGESLIFLAVRASRGGGAHV